MNTEEVILIGYSGHGYVAVDILQAEYRIRGYCDKSEVLQNPFELKYLGPESDYSFKNALAFVSIGDNSIRRKIMESLEERVKFAIARHPESVVGYGCTIGAGSMLAANSICNPLVIIGKGVIINTAAVIEHECQIDDYAHIAPGAVLAGNVKVGEATFVGARSVVKQGVKIGRNVTIGAGAVIIKDVPDNVTVVGNPGRIIKSNN